MCFDRCHPGSVQPLTRQQSLVGRTTSKQIVQFSLTDRTIGLGITTKLGSRVTGSCHVTVTLKYFLAEPCWGTSLMNLRVGALVLHGNKKKVRHVRTAIPCKASKVLNIHVFSCILMFKIYISCMQIAWNCILTLSHILNVPRCRELTRRADVTDSPEVKGDSSLRTSRLFCVWLRVKEKLRLWATGAERPRWRMWSMD